MIKPAVILVLDIGKTHSKISLVRLSDGCLLDSCKTQSKGLLTYCYKAIDVEALWKWFFQQTQQLVKRFDIQQIIPTTHGATAALIDNNELVFPIMDYEFDQYHQIDSQYLTLRPDFIATASPNLAAGLNLGRQLFWFNQQFPEDWKKIKAILTFPQYCCWKLCGIKVSEVTSLGCHTDLWNYKESKFSKLVIKNDWLKLFPEIKNAGSQLGTITKAIANLSGLDDSTVILNGIHDSNASLVTYLDRERNKKNIISSGTWTVICSLESDVIFEPLTQEMMISMNYKNEPVPSIRFMGGREWEILQTTDQAFDITIIEEIIVLECYPYPAFVDAGPFAGRKSKIINENLLNDCQRAAIGCLYLVLMTRYCLDKLQNDGDIIVEGSLTKNNLFLQLLQVLSAGQQVQISSDQTGTTYGAARLSPSANNWPAISLEPQKLLQVKGFQSYYQKWLREL